MAYEIVEQYAVWTRPNQNYFRIGVDQYTATRAPWNKLNLPPVKLVRVIKIKLIMGENDLQWDGWGFI